MMAARPAFVPSLGAAYVPFIANVFVPDDSVKEHPYYFAAMLNSRLLWQWYQHHAKRRGVSLEINGRVPSETPIRRIDFHDAADQQRHARLVELAGKMLERPDGQISQTSAETDLEIDELVCELYGIRRSDLSP